MTDLQRVHRETDPLSWLVERAGRRTAAGLRRTLRPRRPGDELLDLASNDYLGLTRHPDVIAGAVEATTSWGAGATGSRLVTGSTQAHEVLESELADFAGAAGALVFSSGYLANLGAITALVGRGDLVVSDAYNHASIIDACRLSRARVAVTPHGDVEAVRDVLARREEARALVVTEGVFSIDGDRAPLADLAAVTRHHDAVLLVDEAHSLGVVGEGGRGAVVDAGLATDPRLVRTVTLSKALGSQGGAVIGARAVIDHLVDAARPFMFDTGLAPACVGAARAALGVLRSQPELPALVRQRASAIRDLSRRAGLVVAGEQGEVPEAALSAVVSVPLGDPDTAMELARGCAELGVRVGCFRPPSVPDSRSRLRLTARANLTEADLALLEKALDTAKTWTAGLV